MPGLTPEVGHTLAQAAAVCLQQSSHAPGVSLECVGSFKSVYELHWSEPANAEQAARTWADQQEATESGAVGVAIALVRKAASKVVWQRSAKGTGVDYWLCDAGDEPQLFQGTSRLEVSGIRTGSSAMVEQRARQKLKQVERSNSSGTDAYVAIVEFSTPRGMVVRK